MPRKRFKYEQIAFALRQAENGATVDEVSATRLATALRHLVKGLKQRVARSLAYRNSGRLKPIRSSPMTMSKPLITSTARGCFDRYRAAFASQRPVKRQIRTKMGIPSISAPTADAV